MKVIVLSCVAALLLGGAAALVMRGEHRPVHEAYSTGGARVGDPGSNLVGPGWYGTDPGKAPQS